MPRNTKAWADGPTREYQYRGEKIHKVGSRWYLQTSKWYPPFKTLKAAKAAVDKEQGA